MKCSLLTLSIFLDEELDARKRGEVEAHLVACDRCSRGLTHLREESDRVSLLAQVQVADHSAHDLMEQVGIIDAGIRLPMKTNASVMVIPEETRPWMAGGTGKALPWKPQRAVVSTVTAPATPSEVRNAPAAQDEGDSSDGSSPSTWNDTSDQYVVDEPTEPFNNDAEDQAPKPVQPEPWFPPGTTAESLTADPRLPLVTSPPASPPARPSAPPPAPASPPPPSVQYVPQPIVQSPPEIPGEVDEPPLTLTPAYDPPAAPTAEQTPLSFQPEAASIPPAEDSIYEESLHDEIHDDIPPPYEPEPFVTRSAPPPLPPIPPVRASKPSGFMSRVRDAIAVRRAVRSLPDDDSVEMFNGDGTPGFAQPPRRPVAPPRDEADQERRLQAAAAAAAPENTESVRDELEIQPAIVAEPEPEPVPTPEPIYAPEPEPIHTFAPEREPFREPITEPIAGTSARDDETSLHDLREQALKPSPMSFEALAKPARVKARSLQSRIPSFDKRLLAVGAVALLILIVGIATGKSSKVAPTTSASHSKPASSATTTNKTTSSAVPSATPKAVQPTGTSVALTNTKTAGNGGTGYAIEDVRYGQHPNDFRIVFDMTGGTGFPTVVVGFKTPTVMDVVFTGATPSNATGVLPNTTTVTKVTILPRTTSGQTVYEYTLAHPVTVNKPAYYPSPTKLVLDLI
jgi:anti-sigma factor RsiW